MQQSEFFDEIEVGQTRPDSLRRTISALDVEFYRRLSGNREGGWSQVLSSGISLPVPGGVRSAKAERVPDLFTLSAQYGLTPYVQPNRGIIALYRIDISEATAPVNIGDELHFDWEVLDTIPKTSESGTVVTRRRVRNQTDTVVMELTERTLYRTRRAAQDEASGR